MKKLAPLLILILFNFSILHAQEISDFIHVDQFGYANNAEKVAVISNPQIGYNSNQSFTPGTMIEVRDFLTEAVIYTAVPQEWNNGNTHIQSGDSGWWFDFSSVTTTGSYYIFDPTSGHRSGRFEINTNPYIDVLKAAVKMFYYNRCNAPKEIPFASSNWTDVDNFSQDYAVRNAFDQNNPATERDMAGGWFDAGDYNKYVTFAHDPLHQLLSSYENNTVIFSDDWNIPESGDGVSDLLNEIKWELDWLRKMINADGSVYIKMGSLDYNINDNAPPSSNTDPRYYAPTCSSAALSIASTFAHAAKVFKTIPALASYATLLEEDAILCWNYFLPFFNSSNLQIDCDDQTVKAGDADWDTVLQTNYAVAAASYLFDLTGNTTYSDFVVANINTLEPIINSYWSPDKAVLLEAVLNYSSLSGANQTAANTIVTSAITSINNNWGEYFDYSDADLYRGHSPDWIYYWGSNKAKADVANLCLTMIKYNVSPSSNVGLKRKADEQLHYFHGINPLGIIYLSNMYEFGGDRCANEIFHTWFNDGTDWDHALSSLYGPAPGFLAGGPNQAYTGTLSPPANQPLQKCYLDYNDGYMDVAWEITEPAIYYQAAYIMFLSNYVNTAQITTATHIGVEDDFIEIFPNPTNDFFTLQGNLQAYSIQILNLNGSVYQTLNPTGDQLTIDISSLPIGMFFIQVQNLNTSSLQVQKILKMN